MNETIQDDLLERARFVVQLFRECDAIQLPHGPTEQVLTGMIDRIEELEAKLAKAVEAMQFWSEAVEPDVDKAITLMASTLAALKGQDK